MLLRRSIVSAVLATGLAALTAPALAQFLPPTFAYPRDSGYRDVPDQNGVMTLDPEDDEFDPPVSPRGAPYARSMPDDQGAPYPYDPRLNRRSPGYDPRYSNPYDPRNPNPRNDNPQAAPTFDPRAGAPRGPFGHYGNGAAPSGGYMARPGDVPTSLQPPAAIQTTPVPPAAVPGTSTPGTAAQSRPNTVAALPPEDQPEEGAPKELPAQFKRQIVPYVTKEPAGTIVIDTPSTYLYYVNGDGTAVRYGIGVGREGFTWSGTEKITRLAEWPDWHPPAEMIERQPYLPRFMAGGPGNPLGARALYLGKTVYRIHGTNQPSTIGQFVSSGCIRMLNEDVEDLYSRVKVGTRVVVRPGGPPASVSSSAVPIAR